MPSSAVSVFFVMTKKEEEKEVAEIVSIMLPAEADDEEFGQHPRTLSAPPPAHQHLFTAKHRRYIVIATALALLMIALTVLITLMLVKREDDLGAVIEEGAPAGQQRLTNVFNPSKKFFFGDLSITNTDLGIQMSAGLSVRVIATAGKQVEFSDGKKSNLKYHTMTDGAGILELDNGNYAYVVNSEVSSGDGGAYALYFDSNGNVYDYKVLLKGTSRNCSGGKTPWNTFISCEEYGRGQCYQIEPNPNHQHFGKPEATLLGDSNGGRYEAVAVDNRDPHKPVFYVTEDHKFGALRRFVANGQGWDALHSDGDTSFLLIKDDKTFEWTTNQNDAMKSANKYYMNTEGIAFDNGFLYVMAKVEQKMLTLDLDRMTYETELSGKKFHGAGSFSNQPDQLIVGPSRNFLFYTEDGGDSPGVFVRFSGDEMYSCMFEGIPGGVYDGDETVGIALSPNKMRFYAGFQDAGVIMEFTRVDGLPFQ